MSAKSNSARAMFHTQDEIETDREMNKNQKNGALYVWACRNI
jgi:hypothetical protein